MSSVPKEIKNIDHTQQLPVRSPMLRKLTSFVIIHVTNLPIYRRTCYFYSLLCTNLVECAYEL